MLTALPVPLLVPPPLNWRMPSTASSTLIVPVLAKVVWMSVVPWPPDFLNVPAFVNEDVASLEVIAPSAVALKVTPALVLIFAELPAAIVLPSQVVLPPRVSSPPEITLPLLVAIVVAPVVVTLPLSEPPFQLSAPLDTEPLLFVVSVPEVSDNVSTVEDEVLKSALPPLREIFPEPLAPLNVVV